MKTTLIIEKIKTADLNNIEDFFGDFISRISCHPHMAKKSHYNINKVATFTPKNCPRKVDFLSIYIPHIQKETYRR
jgi:hypothetical protein